VGMNVKVQESNFVPNQHHRGLALAALFEGNFSIDWLVELSERRVSEILFTLEGEIRRGLLARKEPGVFCFRDLDKRQKYHDLLTAKEKKKLHRHIAGLLIRDLPEDDNKAQSIAYHLSHISNDIEGSHWLIKAGDAYLKSYGIEKALQCYGKVLKDLSYLRGEKADWLFTEATIRYSKISTGRHDTIRVLSTLNKAMGRAKRRNRQTCQALLEMHIAKNEWMRSNYNNALKHFEDGWSMTTNLNDPKLLRSSTTFSAFFLYWQGRFKEVIHTYEKSVPDLEKYPQGKFPLLAAIAVGRCYAQIGQASQGLGMIDAILKYCQEIGYRSMAAYAGVAMGLVMLNTGSIENALQYLKCSLEDAKYGHNDWVKIAGNLALAFTYYLKEENKQSIVHLRRFLQQSSHVKVIVRPYGYLMELCWAMEQGKLPLMAGLSLEEEVKQSIDNKNIFMKGVAYRYQALLQKLQNQPHERIMKSLNISLRWLEESGDQIEQAKTQLKISRQYLLLGNEEKAKETAVKAYEKLSPINEVLFPDDLRSFINVSSLDGNLLDEIMKLSQTVITIRDNRDLVQHIISTVNRITGAERGAIFLLEGDNNFPRLRLRASKNLTSNHVTDPEFEASMNMIKDVALTGQGRMQVINKSEILNPISDRTIRSRIAVPMILRDKMTGVLYNDNCLLRSAFRESDLESLAYFAAQAAFALDNAAAYKEISLLNQKLREEKLYYKEEHLQELHIEDIVGESPAIKHTITQVNQVANTDTTVLILGETGVGKELVARAIHRNSTRRDNSFIRVDCNALTDSLIPTELFGHEKGSFTGADQRRIGRFELADGGTLFLDEIGDLSLDTQVRLLQVLESKEFERVGGNETLHSDFRLVAATNCDLEREVKANKFRADLYYRLNVFPIYISPLRDRKEDIPLLALHFLNIYSTKLRKTFKGIPKTVMHKMIEYDWPGNVRELQNIIERGTILSSCPRFRMPELKIDHMESAPPKDVNSLEENERRHILWTLHKTGWKIRGQGGAAELLNIHPSTLRFRMKKLGIQRPEDLPMRGSFSSAY
jgi:transcriptional regulator with GAF, ATPase, and Fis domain